MNLQMWDFAGLIVFLLGFFGYAFVIDFSGLKKYTLNHAINQQRSRWMELMAGRQLRMMDTDLLNGLLSGIAFFASTSLLGVGAGFTLLTAGEKLIPILNEPQLTGAFDIHVSSEEFYVKVVGVMLIFAYAFFKFGWAYRLFNYTLILAGAMPTSEDAGNGMVAVSEEGQRQARKAADMSIIAAGQFNSGLRAIFFSMAYLCWFAGPILLMVGTAAVTAVLAYRQFGSPARRIMLRED